MMHLLCAIVVVASCLLSPEKNDSKQDATTTIAHIKYIIELLKQRNIMSNILITTWERMDGCDEQYRCSTELYRMPIMSQAFSVIINRSISAPGHGREVVDGLNSIEKRFLFQLMSTVQLSGGKRYDKQMFMHTGPYVQCYFV